MKVVVVRIRGEVDVRGPIEDTLTMLNLKNKNYATVIEDTPQNIGMLAKVKDYVTYGPIDDATLKELLEKRGEAYEGREKDKKSKITYKKFIEIDGKKYKRYFRLQPPRKGYGKNGVKRSFKMNGATGDRKEQINDLIKRML